MQLCFGTFASVLNRCRSTIPQAAFIAKMICVIDPQNRCKGEDMAGDGPTITKLLSCKIDFVLSDGGVRGIPEQGAIAKQLELNVSPFIDEDKKAKVIIALLNIIQKDGSLDFEKKENFRKYFGFEKQQLLQQSEFVFSDFLSRVLLYTIWGNVSNRQGSQDVKKITTTYIDDIAKPYLYEYEWNSHTQTVTLLYTKIFLIFNNALINNHIKQFICQVDPTNMMNYSWVEKCENFLEDTEKNIWIPFAYDPLGWTLQEIQLFAQTLNGYINYLGVQMRAQPIGHVETFVPRFRDENPAWELQFSKNVEHYRHELIKIYEDIYKHMPFFIPDSSQ